MKKELLLALLFAVPAISTVSASDGGDTSLSGNWWRNLVLGVGGTVFCGVHAWKLFENKKRCNNRLEAETKYNAAEKAATELRDAKLAREKEQLGECPNEQALRFNCQCSISNALLEKQEALRRFELYQTGNLINWYKAFWFKY